MTFLKKLGLVLAKGLAVATGIWPLVSGFFGSGSSTSEYVPKVINDLTQIGGIIVQVEAVIQTPGSGAAKLAAATPLIANVVRTSELISGKKIANETLFLQGCGKLGDGMADILNSLHPDAAQTASTN
jgi:protein-disulfide isomerase